MERIIVLKFKINEYEDHINNLNKKEANVWKMNLFSITDIETDIFVNKQTSELNLNKGVIPLPTHYNNIQEWIKGTNHPCWFCGLKFTKFPVQLVTSYEENNINVMGIFCTFTCCYHYDKLYHNGKYWPLVKIIIFKLTKQNISFINKLTQLPQETLAKYGYGKMKDEEYRELMFNSDKSLNIFIN